MNFTINLVKNARKMNRMIMLLTCLMINFQTFHKKNYDKPLDVLVSFTIFSQWLYLQDGMKTESCTFYQLERLQTPKYLTLQNISAKDQYKDIWWMTKKNHYFMISASVNGNKVKWRKTNYLSKTI